MTTRPIALVTGASSGLGDGVRPGPGRHRSRPHPGGPDRTGPGEAGGRTRAEPRGPVRGAGGRPGRCGPAVHRGGADRRRRPRRHGDQQRRLRTLRLLLPDAPGRRGGPDRGQHHRPRHPEPRRPRRHGAAPIGEAAERVVHRRLRPRSRRGHLLGHQGLRPVLHRGPPPRGGERRRPRDGPLPRVHPHRLPTAGRGDDHRSAGGGVGRCRRRGPAPVWPPSTTTTPSVSPASSTRWWPSRPASDPGA